MKRQVVMSEDELDRLINKAILLGYNLRYSKPDMQKDARAWAELRDEKRNEIKSCMLEE